ncbi:hypothetical protein GTW40_10555 [Streptomyces sp. SID4985]|nr:hypothetical protein [Streptomyces sp. SID4985]
MPVGLHVPEGEVEGSEQVGSQGRASRRRRVVVCSQSPNPDYGQVRSRYAQLTADKVSPSGTGRDSSDPEVTSAPGARPLASCPTRTGAGRP